MQEITMVITMSREAAEHAVDEVEDYTDERYSRDVPYSPSAKWCEFQTVLRDAYDKAIEKSE